MRKVIVSAFISLDGVIQAPGGPGEDPSGAFHLGGWTYPYVDAVFGAAMGELFARPFALLLGRRTYDIFAAHWPNLAADADDAGIAALFNGATKYVATHRPESVHWQNSEVLDRDLDDRIRALKRQDGPDLLTQGSSDVVHQLFKADLVDELNLLTYPVVLGRGKRLFPAHGRSAAFGLVSSEVSTTGVVISRYRRQGPVRTGSFAAG